MSGYFASTATAPSKVANERGRIFTSSYWNEIPSMVPENFWISIGTSSGQPSPSSNPFLVSGLSPHLSTSSMNPSPSLSRMGQPSGATPFSSVHLSHGNNTPSPSLSGSGQPLGWSPASREQWSSASITPSLSESTGQPSGLRAGARGH